MPPKNGNSKGQTSGTKRLSKKEKATVSWDDEVEEPFQLSQSSSASDDGMMAAIAQKMKATMDKKKKDKEAKFIQMAKNTLTKTISGRAMEFMEGTKDIEEIFSEFTLAYATAEDNIRKLQVSIVKELQKLQTLSDQKHSRSLESEKAREEEHIRSLTHVRKACEDFQRVMDLLELQGDES